VCKGLAGRDRVARGIAGCARRPNAPAKAAIAAPRGVPGCDPAFEAGEAIDEVDGEALVTGVGEVGQAKGKALTRVSGPRRADSIAAWASLLRSSSSGPRRADSIAACAALLSTSSSAAIGEASAMAALAPLRAGSARSACKCAAGCAKLAAFRRRARQLRHHRWANVAASASFCRNASKHERFSLRRKAPSPHASPRKPTKNSSSGKRHAKWVSSRACAFSACAWAACRWASKRAATPSTTGPTVINAGALVWARPN